MRVATDLELKKRANLRAQQYLFEGKHTLLNVLWLTKCLEATPEQLESGKRIQHTDSEYVCDVGKDEEYRCKDCGAIWYLEIPEGSQ